MSEPAGPKLQLDEEVERSLQNRLSRLEGQVRGIKRMLSEHHSCDDILVQVAALRQAVTGVAVQLLEAHMETCVAQGVEGTDSGQTRSALRSLKTALSRVLKHT